ncbi:hypothetical protein H072_206 [Dactylellina haptotyla CBS 200.50]|uniref:protein-tyrosine-phosphatase n=1 Tax=Dactylellina haptotyla (strain CBS 200.50) TaxID=1284197 RepID=S8CDE8_DACHA|nr:hypothetical protein H072_206 [Dactylellina haptotyla CBS 200.50]
MRRPEELKEANITHVVSVLRGPLDMTLFAPYKHLHIESDDDEGANLIESFATTNSFIEEGIEQGGGVLVHCAVGISRSVTIATAYLVYKYRMSADMALELVQKSRPIACPNLDFRIQLHIYANNLDQATKNLNEVPSYQKYLYRKEAKRSQITNKPPDIQYFADDNAAAQGDQKSLRCKKCKFILANENAFVTHTPDDDSQCDFYFIDPHRWMTSEFEKGLLEGKLQCPEFRVHVNMDITYGENFLALAAGGLHLMENAIESIGPDVAHQDIAFESDQERFETGSSESGYSQHTKQESVYTGDEQLHKLPYELLRQVCGYLDRNSLKSLRLACPDPKTAAVTSEILFETLVIRLGTPEWSNCGASTRLAHVYGQAKSSLAFSERWEKTGDTTELVVAPRVVRQRVAKIGFWKNVRTLIVDTRYPYVSTPETCGMRRGREPGASSIVRNGAITSSYSKPLEQPIPATEEMALVRLLRRILGEAKGINRIQWKTTTKVPLELHRDLCSLFCDSLDHDIYKVDVALTLFYGEYIMASYLEFLQNLGGFVIRIIAEKRQPSKRECHLISDVVARSPRLTELELYGAYHLSDLTTLDSQWQEALSSVRKLRRICASPIIVSWVCNHGWKHLGELEDIVVNWTPNRWIDYRLPSMFSARGPNKKTSNRTVQRVPCTNGAILGNFSDTTLQYLTLNARTLTSIDINQSSWTPSHLIASFWKELIPRVAKTLRILIVLGYDESWSWSYCQDEPFCDARLAIRQCRKLEDITMNLSAQNTSVIDFATDLLLYCENIKVMNLEFCSLLSGKKARLRNAFDKLDWWRSSKVAFGNKGLTVVCKDYSGLLVSAYDDKPESYEPAKQSAWFDYILVRWELTSSVEKSGREYYFERYASRYMFDEQIIRQPFYEVY